MGSHKIVSVRVVEGGKLNPKWNIPMQKICADPPPSEGRDFYIDNMPGNQFGFFNDPNAKPGFDWEMHVGKTVHGAKVISHDKFQWLNKASN